MEKIGKMQNGADVVTPDDYWDATHVLWHSMDLGCGEFKEEDRMGYINADGRFDSEGYRRRGDYRYANYIRMARARADLLWNGIRQFGEYKKSPYRNSTSEYVVDRKGGIIYRRSDHWGGVCSCDWPVDREGPGGVTIAFANISEFTRLS